MTTGTVYKWLAVLLFATYGLTALASSNSESTAPLFNQLMEESGLALTPPPGFTHIKPVDNPVLPYEHALRHISGRLEIRYIIRPLGRISIDYDDPHNAAPEPNHLFPLLFESLINMLSSGGNTPNTEYPTSQAQELFNAGWAAAAVFDVNPDFSDSYTQGLLIGMHKDGQADAYSLFLYNEYSQAKKFIKGALSSLSFVQ